MLIPAAVLAGHDPGHDPGHEPRHEPRHDPGHEPALPQSSFLQIPPSEVINHAQVSCSSLAFTLCSNSGEVIKHLEHEIMLSVDHEMLKS